MMLLALVLTAVIPQETVCEQIGGTTRCRSNPTTPSPRLVEPPAPPVETVDPEAAKNRRAAAYAQVGQLIADKRCDDAKRLAAFYGQKDLIEDTERACR